MKILRSLYLIINYRTLIIAALAVISTYACFYWNIQANFPLTLIGIAIVFPVVFSIDSAYKRRERALTLLGDMKAHLLAVHQSTVDWLDDRESEFIQDIKSDISDVFQAVKEYLINGEPEDHERESRIYKSLNKLSTNLQRFRKFGLQAGEVSRINQYISKIGIDVENMKMILKYRTPITLRAYSKVFIYTFPIIYGPYFVYASRDYSGGLEYVMPLMFSFILVSLDNIQAHLENPFDQVGEDDIRFDNSEISLLLNSTDS